MMLEIGGKTSSHSKKKWSFKLEKDLCGHPFQKGGRLEEFFLKSC
jgi:hypothetical protein